MFPGFYVPLLFMAHNRKLHLIKVPHASQYNGPTLEGTYQKVWG